MILLLCAVYEYTPGSASRPEVNALGRGPLDFLRSTSQLTFRVFADSSVNTNM